MLSGCWLVQRQQPREKVALLARGAVSSEDVAAIAPKPFVNLGSIGKALWICGGRERLEGLSGHCVLAFGTGVRRMTSGTAPIAALLHEQLPAALGGERDTCSGLGAESWRSFAGVRSPAASVPAQASANPAANAARPCMLLSNSPLKSSLGTNP